MKIKRFIIIMLLGTMVFHLSGCTKKDVPPQTEETDEQAEANKLSLQEIREQAQELDVSFQNLDLSDAEIIIPQVDEVYDLTFPVSADSLERQVEKFEENIRKYEGLEEDVDLTQYMSVMYYDNEQEERLTVPFNEATDAQKETIQYLGYNDGTCSELIIFSSFMLEMGDYSVPTQLTGDDTDYSQQEYGYRGYNLGTLVEKYNLPQDDITGISYPLSDGDTSLDDAVSYVEKHMKEDYYFAGSKHLDYHVFGVTVRKLSEDVYYYEFDVSTSYQGVSLDKEDATGITYRSKPENEDPASPFRFATNHLVTMFQKERLGFIWSCCQNFESVNVNDTYQNLLPLENVCSLLSDYLSPNVTFQISSVELIYQTEFEYENEEKKYWGYIQSVHANPAYHFVVSNTGLSEYNKLYFNVDAVSGKVSAMAS